MYLTNEDGWQRLVFVRVSIVLMKRIERIVIIAAICIIAAGIYGVWMWLTVPLYLTAPSEAPIKVQYTPRQSSVEGVSIPAIKIGGNDVYLFPIANYDISSVLVSKRRYRSGFMCKLSPWDYALVWGDVPQYLDYLDFDQIIRYCLFTARADSPIDPGYVQVHMSNNHLIPANKNVRRALPLARVGDKIKIEGYLVYVEAIARSGCVTKWQSSTSRTDTGYGACEIIYVTSLRIGDKIYQ